MSFARLASSLGSRADGGAHSAAVLREEFRQNPARQAEGVPHARQVQLLYTLKGAEKVRWAHAVNSLEELNAVLQAGEAHFAEADVSTSAVDPELAIMAHNRGTAAGDSFEAWIRAAVANNIHAAQRGARPPLGVKLDFKDENAARLALAELAELQTETKEAEETPLWLNADVLRGPNGGPAVIDADWFVIQCLRAKPTAVLSLGWTTSGASVCERVCGPSPGASCWFGRFSPSPKAADDQNDDGGENGGGGGGQRYTRRMVDEMLELCERYRLVQVTFAVRYMYVRNSVKEMRRLLNYCPSYTLTVFTTGHDADPDPEWIARNLPTARVFIDAGGSSEPASSA